MENFTHEVFTEEYTDSPSTVCGEEGGERWRDEAEKEVWGPGPGGSEKNSEKLRKLNFIQ